MSFDELLDVTAGVYFHFLKYVLPSIAPDQGYD